MSIRESCTSSFCYFALHCTTFHCITLHYIPLHYIALDSIALHCITLRLIMRMHCVVSRRFTQHYLTLLPCFALHTAHYTRHTTHCTPHTSHHTPNTTHYTLHIYTIIYIFGSEYHAFTFDVCARLSSEGQPDPLKQKLSLPQVMVICCNMLQLSSHS